MPVCLYCHIPDVSPDTLAGLCVSCQCAVRLRELAPAGAREGTLSLGGEPYDPAELFDTPQEPATLAAVRAELLALYVGPPTVRLRAAKATIEAIRREGITLSLHTGLGYAEMDNPARCPYPLLIEFVRLQDTIQDELTLEAAHRLAERAREEAERDADFRGDDFVQHEQNGEVANGDQETDRGDVSEGRSSLCSPDGLG